MAKKPEDLKPCPFCGSKAGTNSWYDGMWLYNAGCYSKRCRVQPLAEGDSAEVAARNWNRRKL